jgi:hypothetical protein
VSQIGLKHVKEQVMDQTELKQLNEWVVNQIVLKHEREQVMDQRELKCLSELVTKFGILVGVSRD